MSSKKIVLAFSGGLDTSFCVPWLVEQGYEVTTLFVDTGGVSDSERDYIARRSAELGAADHVVEDGSSEVWQDVVVPLLRGGRWRELPDCWEPLAADGFYAFNDAHAMMAFVATGRDTAAEALLAAQQRAIKGTTGNAGMTWEVGYPLCSALRAFGREDYGTCISLLRPIRSRLNRFGGSHAQRDVFDLTLMEAAKRDGHYSLLRQLANERVELKPSSPLNRRYRQDAARWAAQAVGVAGI